MIRKPTKPIIMATKKRPFQALASTEAYKLSPKDLRHVIPRAPTKVVNSDKGVEIGTQASALTTVRRTVTTKTTYEENGRNVEIIEVVEQVL
ncbi:Hypothetical predicted protein [Mytilus galloprovincialis]|uniref:Uncharacterized protein n=2 Tax=Mytilus galloprovincialis TaxID=29158 RepID=A0A8B6DGP0_MYTGA|nr:Hypothetical predicted protein [Mytilus galloprovincialis]